MKSLLYPLTAFLLVSCGDDPKVADIQYPEDATVLSVQGMHCSGCKATVMRALSVVEGVDWAQIEVELAEVAYSGPAAKTNVVSAITDAGYEVLE